MTRDEELGYRKDLEGQPLPLITAARQIHIARELGHTYLEREAVEYHALLKRIREERKAAKMACDEELEADERPEDCPGCGCAPGEGITEGCTHPDGCGYYGDMN